MQADIEILLIAVVVAVMCAVPGTFLVLRRMSMMSDSITHTILLGIVLAFFAVQNLSSPVLLVGAAAIGLITVFLTEGLHKTKLVSEDSAVGIVFPLLFSVAIILITRYAGSVHLDTDSVLLGELAFAPFDRLVLFGSDIGPKALYTSGVLLLVNIVFVALFFKELKAATFDPIHAAILGLSPALVHYGLMTLVSLTTVGAFEAVGSVLVVAFMIGPPATAYLLTDDLKKLLLLSCGIGAAAGIGGFFLAIWLDVSIAGSMAVVVGIVFVLVLLTAKKRGIISVVRRRKRQRKQFNRGLILFFLLKETHAKGIWIDMVHLSTKLAISPQRLQKHLTAMAANGDVEIQNGYTALTPQGVAVAQTAVKDWKLNAALL